MGRRRPRPPGARRYAASHRARGHSDPHRRAAARRLPAAYSEARRAHRVREELRSMESDRIAVVVGTCAPSAPTRNELRDGFVVRGTAPVLRGRVTTHGDHRMAMAFGILARCRQRDRDRRTPTAWRCRTPRSGAIFRRHPRGEHAGRTVIAIDGRRHRANRRRRRGWLRLGFRHVDSGSLYRGLTSAMLRRICAPPSGRPTQSCPRANT